MKVIILSNLAIGLYKFRKELLETLIKQNFEVYILLPYDDFVTKLKELGCKYIETNIDRRGTNAISDAKLLISYLKVIKKIEPDVVLTYTIKPNIYGGLVCKYLKIPYIANITGLGTSIENEGIIRKITLNLYKMGLKKAKCVFFQNEPNRRFFIEKKIANGKSKLIPGSGVNLSQHIFEEYPNSSQPIKFIFIGRIMKAKGIDELIEAVRIVKSEYNDVEFDFIGITEEDYLKQLNELEFAGIIKYHGQQDDIHSFIKNSHATILPSYHEGTSNVLLETASTGRPVLASKVTGCMETFDDGITGIGFEVKNVQSLVSAIFSFINLPYNKKKSMGIAARKKMETEFDRMIVVNSYIEEINNIIRGNKNELI